MQIGVAPDSLDAVVVIGMPDRGARGIDRVDS
jgi:hypothetical protein